MKDNFRMNIILLLCIWAIGGHLWVLYDRTYQQGLEIKQLMLQSGTIAQQTKGEVK